MRYAVPFALLPVCLVAQTAPTAAEARAQVLQRLAKDQVDSAEDFLAAAQILAQSAQAGDALAARELALVAWLKGKPNALVGQAEDAYFRALGLPARFSQAGTADTSPTDTHRLDFLMPPLVPRVDAEAQQAQRLQAAWWHPEKQQRFHNLLVQITGAPKSQPLGPTTRAQLVQGFQEDLFRTPEDLAAAAKIFTRSDRPGDLMLASELALLAAVRGDVMSRILFAQTWDRAARGLGQPARYGTLGSQTMDPGVAPGVIRALGFSGRPTQR
jgi:hypothetical protein